ncbi:hypothetical protein [Hyalangium rubrum]|uniref:STAS domain-containing protein n=1 Tax=Hyalangium rubrum TaxID=3103134 RepID=A0ABU5GWP9_9BACT|nr:hypothetical protein [Hyalangium sp. s54d21]MDY7225621.1 hypothetical protein [Hyalangium sp. s54d21]
MEAARYTVKNEPSERTIYIRMEGFFEEEEMRKFSKVALEATDTYGGQPHLVLADMRGMQIASIEVSKLFGEYIGSARQKGVACCAHLSTSTVQKLQAARLARENSPGDDVTVNVVSIEEAHKLFGEARRRLGFTAR